MGTAALREAIEAERRTGDRPLMVVGTAGSVSAGALDGLDVIADLCRDLDIWFHVDGAHEELVPLTREQSIATFRYVPRELRNAIGTDKGEAYLNRLNEELLERVQRSGEAFVSSAMTDGCYARRACIVNFNTEVSDIGALPAIASRLGRQVHAGINGSA